MYQRSDVREGMTVRSIDGEKLGKIFAVQDGEFLIEKGLFFPKDYVCRYSEISDIHDGEVILLHGKEGLHRFSLDEEHGVLADQGMGAGVERPMVGKDEVAVPVYKEDLDVIKREKQRREVKDRPAMQASFQEETVRREKVEIRGEGDVEGPRKLDLTPDDPNLRRS